jgi:hypothetical protein
MKIYWPENDKLLHSYYGDTIAILTALALATWWGGEFKPLVVIITLLAAVLKELYDWKIKKTKFDWLDVFYTVFKSFGIMAIMYLMDK